MPFSHSQPGLRLRYFVGYTWRLVAHEAARVHNASRRRGGVAARTIAKACAFIYVNELKFNLASEMLVADVLKRQLNRAGSFLSNAP